ncbi:uncharacterized protein [Watersipora subatra]|uniref:uncharacterized protein n=1 Tax=Watersipora subatra TaxID=2589382 RepID=UPI00355C88FD
MTKSNLLNSEEKPAGQNPEPLYTAVQLNDYDGQLRGGARLPGNTCWYVCGILSTIFCCLPCGVVGLVHAMIAKHEGERGNLPGYQTRMRQAKCWTSWSIVLGLLTLIAFTLYVIGMTIGFSRVYQWCSLTDVDYIDYVYEERNSSGIHNDILYTDYYY